MQIHSLTLLQGWGGGLMKPLPADADMLQYFKMILPSLESL